MIRNVIGRIILKYVRFRMIIRKRTYHRNAIVNRDYLVERFDDTDLPSVLTDDLENDFPFTIFSAIIGKNKIAASLLIDNINSIKVNHIKGFKRIIELVDDLIDNSSFDSSVLSSYYLRNYWERYGPDDRLLIRYERYGESMMEKNPDVWLQYISSLFELGRMDDCKDALKKYVDKNGLRMIHNYVPVSKMATINNVINDRIIKSAQLFDYFVSNEDRLREIINGHTVAIVGNSPDEIGRHIGSAIDNYEHVIRFNDFKIDGYEIDYGTKTTIWVRNKDLAFETKYSRIDIKAFDLILFETDIWRFKVEDIVLDNLYHYCEERIPVTYIKGRNAITRELGIFPTSGLLLLHYLNEDIGEKVEYNTFGFSTDHSGIYRHYYESSDRKGKYNVEHDLEVEGEYIAKNNYLRSLHSNR